MVHPDEGKVFSAEMKWAITPQKDMGENKFIIMLLSERSQCAKATHCMIPTKKRQNFGDSKKISGCQQLGGRKG